MTFAPIQDQLGPPTDPQAKLHQFFLRLIQRQRSITPAKTEGFQTTNTTSDSEAQGDGVNTTGH